MRWERRVKNAVVRTALVSMMAIIPAVSFAQSADIAGNGAATRAQVTQELVDLESVGYNPASANDATYPEDAQKAMRRLAAKRADEARLAQSGQQQEQAQEQLEQSGYGSPAASKAQAGAPAVVSGGDEPPAYRHH